MTKKLRGLLTVASGGRYHVEVRPLTVRGSVGIILEMVSKDNLTPRGRITWLRRDEALQMAGDLVACAGPAGEGRGSGGEVLSP